MADINFVYGDNYQKESKIGRLMFVCNNIAKNLANRNYTFKIPDGYLLFDNDGKIIQDAIDTIINKIIAINKNMYVKHLHKNKSEINIVRDFVINIPVEYLLILDKENKCYQIIIITQSDIYAQ